jgi:hypothetical protein
MLSEWDLRPEHWNLLNVVSRRREAYHESLFTEESSTDAVNDDGETRTIHGGLRRKEANLERYLVFDAYWRGGFQEHLLPIDTDVEAFAAGRFSELGQFLAGEYTPYVEERPGSLHVRLHRDGWVEGAEGRQPLSIVKGLSLGAEGQKLNVDYALTNTGERAFHCLLLSEWNMIVPQSEGDIRTSAKAPSAYVDGPAGSGDSVLDRRRSWTGARRANDAARAPMALPNRNRLQLRGRPRALPTGRLPRLRYRDGA